MNQSVCTVAVDVGNTAVKLALRRNQRVIHHVITHHDNCWPQKTLDWVHQQLGCAETRWRISSVHRRTVETLTDAITRNTGQADAIQIHRVGYQDVPIDVAVRHPERLGIDRLLSSFAAVNLVRVEKLLDERSGLVVVDAGSAITVDWVTLGPSPTQACFHGGAILPGLALQAKALATGTDALPEVDWSADRKPSLPADNTDGAIFGGILTGAAAAIDSLARRYAHILPEPFSPSNYAVILTGGDASTLSPHVMSPHQVHEQLVCRGLIDLSDP